MATFTSKNAGNWSATGQTTWNEVGAPAAGDTVTITHAVTVDVNSSFGTSAATPTVECSVTSPGSLTIATGVVLNAKGNLRITNTTLTLNAGAIYEFDSSAATGTPLYKIVMGTAASEQNTKVIANGTSGSHCVFRKHAGSGNGLIGMFGSGLTAWAQARCTYTDFTDLGTTTTGFDNHGIYLNPSNSAKAEAYFDHCTWNNCAGTFIAECAAGNDVVFTFNRWTNPLSSVSCWITMTDATTGGLRTVTDNVFPTETYTGSTQGHKAFLTSHGYKGLIFERNVLGQFLPTSMSTWNPLASLQKNLVITRAAQNTWGITAGAAGDTLSNNYVAVDCASGVGDPCFIVLGLTGATTSGNVTVNGNVFETTCPTEDGNTTHLTPTAASGITTFIVTNNVVAPNSRGRASGSFNSHGGSNTNAKYEHNTGMTSDNFAPSGSGEAVFGTGSGYDNHTGMFPTINNNLNWSRTSRAADSIGNYNFVAHSVAPVYTGTATSGTTTTLTNTGQAPIFQTGTKTSLGDAGAIVIITGKTGSGPPIGETRTISSNTTTQLTVSTAFSAAPDTGTTYKVHTIDNITQCLNNANYNVGTGTISDQAGNNPTTSKGYNGWWLTNYATFANADIDLGTGTDETTQGPMFVDVTRNLALFDTVYLGNVAPLSWIVTHGTYNYGDIVSSASTATDPNLKFYNNAVINYRCVLTHTAAAGNQPGVGATWRTNWELASVYRIREAIMANTLITDPAIGVTGVSYIEALTAWVRKGFTPRNPLLRGTASDAGDIGAMPVLAITNISPSSGAQGTAPTITLTGANTTWGVSSAVTVTPSANVTVSGTSATSATSLGFTLTIGAGAATGARTITVTTGSEVVTTSFNITAAAASISSIVPSSGAQGATVPVTITGSSTHFDGTTTVAVSGTGVTASGTSAGSATSLTTTLTITAGAATGARTVTVTTGAEIVTTTFTVNPVASIFTISPAAGVQGTAPSVTITGSNTNFVNGTTTVAVSGTGVSASAVSVSSPTNLTCTFTITAGAATGARTVTVTTGTEAPTTSFTVNPSAAAITNITPSSGAQGAAVPVTITGSNTHFDGTTGVSVSGSGVTVSAISASSATSLGCTLTIAAGAATGSRTVTVTTTSSSETVTTNFTVNASVGSISGIVPNTGAQSAAVPVTITGSGTHFDGTSAVSVSGSGVTVSLTNATSATNLTCTLTIAAGAPTGSRTVTVFTSSSSETVTTNFTVTAAATPSPAGFGWFFVGS